MQRTQTLRQAFTGNGLFSLCAALAFLLAADSLAAFVGLENRVPLLAVGVGLIPFGAMLLWLARSPGLSVRTGRVVIAMDVQWILATAVLLLGWPDLLNQSGRLIALAIAIAVAGFAVWQVIGTRKLALEYRGSAL